MGMLGLIELVTTLVLFAACTFLVQLVVVSLASWERGAEAVDEENRDAGETTGDLARRITG